MVFKCLHGSVPQYLADLIKVKGMQRNLRSIIATILTVPKTKLKTGECRFSVSGPNVWNSLPAEVRNCVNLSAFKSKLKSYFYCLSYNM